MTIIVHCYIPYLKGVTGEYKVEEKLTVKQFIEFINVKWDDEALVVVNKIICSNPNQLLSDRDMIDLLIPISGG